jgi:Autophagy-related protein 13
MASPPPGAGVHAATGPRVKCDQVIYEAICKACEIIVGSRANTSGSGVAGSGTVTNSCRFNLQIPEVQSVRSILAQHRMQLHVPIRLDVYYQHADGGRELLERWCLEYKTVSSERFLQAEGLVTNDPMVQLTHVCKRVVLWLRTLYCWTRLLPAQQLGGASCQPIGFSIYVHTDYTVDDITELTNQQGFVLQSRGSGVVTTPYGELAWQVLYSPLSKLERLLPTPVRPTVVRIQAPPTSARSRPRPIPVSSNSNHPDQSFTPHSAPSHRPPTYTERSQQKRLEAMKHPDPVTGKSYESGRHLYKKSMTELPDAHHAAHPVVQRSHSSIGAAQSPVRLSKPNLPANGEPPERVMSGLSLALLMASNDDDQGVVGEDKTIFRTNGEEEVFQQGEDDAPLESSARRAALHQMPPHLQESGFTAAPLSMGDYGYGYNNHIPWQKIHPSQSNPALAQPHPLVPTNSFGRALSSSPSSVGAPISPQHLGGATTPPGVFFRSTPPVGGLGHLIPPRNRTESRSVTPPFPSRPAGFLQDPPSLSLEPSPASSRFLEAEVRPKTPSQKTEPMTSLDSLRSSPFQQPLPQRLQEDRASMLSSLSFAVPTLGSDYLSSAHLPGDSSDLLRGSLWAGSMGSVMPSSMAGLSHNHPLFHPDDGYYSEEMPFAIETTTSLETSLQAKGSASKPVGAASSTTFGNASSLASLAQRCAAPNQRLKMFDREVSATTAVMPANDETATTNDSDPVHSLADQLQEFRAFGASLHQSASNFGVVAEDAVLAGSGASSTSTPISLRS